MNLVIKIIVLLFLSTLTTGEVEYEEDYFDYDMAGVGQFDDRLIEVEPATAGQSHFMVSLHHVRKNKHVCAGAIIGKRSVLTAQSCCYEGDLRRDFIIKYDGLNLKRSLRSSGIKKVITSPSFAENTVCIIKLIDRFVMSDKVKMIRMGEKFPHLGHIVWTIGWGITKLVWEEFEQPVRLKQLELTVMPKTECINDPGDKRDIICAMAEQGSACHNDIGSPLVFNRKIVGVLFELADPTCAPGGGNMFVSLENDALRKWIDENRW